MGLVETGVGLIPAGGGCKEMLLRLGDRERAFELVGMAKVSGSAAEASELGLACTRPIEITMNPERLIGDAKALALSLVSTYAPGAPRADIPGRGRAGYALMKMARGSWRARRGSSASTICVMAEKLAHVLSGGG